MLDSFELPKTQNLSIRLDIKKHLRDKTGLFYCQGFFLNLQKSVKRGDKCRHVLRRGTGHFDKVVHNVTRLECLITLKNKYRQDHK